MSQEKLLSLKLQVISHVICDKFVHFILMQLFAFSEDNIRAQYLQYKMLTYCNMLHAKGFFGFIEHKSLKATFGTIVAGQINVLETI